MSAQPGAACLAAALVLFAVLGAAGRAGAQPVRVALVDPRQPTFFTCVNSVPLPPTTPPGARDVVGSRRSACGLASGYTLVVRISDGQGTVPAGKHVIQTIYLQGSQFKLNQATGKCDREFPFAQVKPEYFVTPPGGGAILDHHIFVECCERRFTEDIKVATVIMELPADAAPPIPGFGAGVPYTTQDGKVRIIEAVEENMEALWGHAYAHDTCNRPRQTPSGRVHWMQYSLEYSTGISGATVVTGD